MDPIDDELDAALRRAMTARPEPDLPVDLAARAIRRATAPTRAVYRPVALWRTVSSLAACLVIAGLLTFGAWRWYQSASSFTTSETSDVTTTSVSSADTTSSQNATLLLVGGAVLVLALGLVTLDKLLSTDESVGAP